MILGYHYFTPHRSFQQFRFPLERNRIEREETGHDELIPLTQFETFMQTALAAWENFSDEDKDKLRLAIVALHPLTQPSAQRDYLAMFAALEGLSTLYKGAVVSELSKNWKALEAELSSCIDVQTLISTSTQTFLKENLYALKQGKNLEIRMTEFFKSLKINVGGLWPIFGNNKKLPSLYWARNELAHGRHFSDHRFSAFLVAHEHLSVVLEQAVLGVLGYNGATTGMRALPSKQLVAFQTQLAK